MESKATSAPSTRSTLEVRETLEGIILDIRQHQSRVREQTASAAADSGIKRGSYDLTPLEYLQGLSSAIESNLQQVEQFLQGQALETTPYKDLFVETCEKMLAHLAEINPDENPQIPCREGLLKPEAPPADTAWIFIQTFVPREFPFKPPFGTLQRLCLEIVLRVTQKQVIDFYDALEALMDIDELAHRDQILSSKIEDVKSSISTKLTNREKASGGEQKSKEEISANVDRFFEDHAIEIDGIVKKHRSFLARASSSFDGIHKKLDQISSVLKGGVGIISRDELIDIAMDSHAKIRKDFAESDVPLTFPLSDEELTRADPIEKMVAFREAILKTAAAQRRTRETSKNRSL